MCFSKKLRVVFVSSFFFFVGVIFVSNLEALSYRHWKNVEFLSKRADLLSSKSSVSVPQGDGQNLDLAAMIKKLEEEKDEALSFFDRLVELAKSSETSEDESD